VTYDAYDLLDCPAKGVIVIGHGILHEVGFLGGGGFRCLLHLHGILRSRGLGLRSVGLRSVGLRFLGRHN